jgi:hypothetical protein
MKSASERKSAGQGRVFFGDPPLLSARAHHLHMSRKYAIANGRDR